MAKPATTTLALPRIDLEEKSLDVRLRLKGKAAIDFLDYQRAYEAANGEKVEPEVLAVHVLAAFFEADRGFQTWRRANPPPEDRA